MMFFTALVLTIGFALAVAALAGAFSQSKAVVAALEGMARQPEAAGQIQTAMIIGLAFIESLVIYVLVIAFILNGAMPNAATIGELIKSAH
ncbi:MAG TPA: ATP synthase F0 subunit C [Planctomycetota bacterium]|nr:ATP synthase F0 subunit C [Planctomycetota bacterium]